MLELPAWYATAVMSSIFARHRYRQAHRLAAVVLFATTCSFIGTFAEAQGDDLVAAAGRGDLPAVNALLRSQVDVNARRSLKYVGGTTALIEASSNGQLGVVQALLAANADVNAKRAYPEDQTALTLASQKGHLEVVQALLSAKADPDTKCCTGVTALFLASKEGHLDVVKALLAAKADVNPEDSGGRTALILALSTGHPDVARVLVEAGANVNATTKAGVTALMLVAAGNGSTAMVQALLARPRRCECGFSSVPRVRRGHGSCEACCVNLWSCRTGHGFRGCVVHGERGGSASATRRQRRCEP